MSAAWGLGMRLIYIPSLFFFFFFFLCFFQRKKFLTTSELQKKKAPKEKHLQKKNNCCEFSMTLRAWKLRKRMEERESFFFFKTGLILGAADVSVFSVRSVAVIGLICDCDCD